MPRPVLCVLAWSPPPRVPATPIDVTSCCRVPSDCNDSVTVRSLGWVRGRDPGGCAHPALRRCGRLCLRGPCAAAAQGHDGAVRRAPDRGVLAGARGGCRRGPRDRGAAARCGRGPWRRGAGSLDIEARFGARVAGIVRDCSDSLEPDGAEKDDWETRKREHLAHLAEASADTLMVWMADKVHNGRAIVTDLEAHGPGVLSRFHAPPDRILWYYEANLALAEAQRCARRAPRPAARRRRAAADAARGRLSSAEREPGPLPSAAAQLRSVDEAHDGLGPDRAEGAERQVRVAPGGAVDRDLAGEQVRERLLLLQPARDDRQPCGGRLGGRPPARARRRADGWCARSTWPRARSPGARRRHRPRSWPSRRGRRPCRPGRRRAARR